MRWRSLRVPVGHNGVTYGVLDARGFAARDSLLTQPKAAGQVAQSVADKTSGGSWHIYGHGRLREAVDPQHVGVPQADPLAVTLTSAASWVVASDYGELRHTMPRTCIAEDDVCVCRLVPKVAVERCHPAFQAPRAR